MESVISTREEVLHFLSINPVLDYGYGSGSDYGYGYGFGDIKALNGNIVDYIDSVPTIITQVRGNIACGHIVKKDLTLEPCYIAKVGNFFCSREHTQRSRCGCRSERNGGYAR